MGTCTSSSDDRAVPQPATPACLHRSPPPCCYSIVGDIADNVHRARLSADGQSVVVKRGSPEEEVTHARLAAAQQRVGQHHVPHLLHVLHGNMLVMEDCGASLAAMMERRLVTLESLGTLGAQVVEHLGWLADQQYVHLDVAPQNIAVDMRTQRQLSLTLGAPSLCQRLPTRGPYLHPRAPCMPPFTAVAASNLLRLRLWTTRTTWRASAGYSWTAVVR